MAPEPGIDGEHDFVWYLEKDNYNDATIVVNNAYMKSEVYQRAKKYLRIKKIAIVYTGQAGATIEGALVVGTDAVNYTPWPICRKVVARSGDFIEYDFGERGIEVTIDRVIAAVNVIVLTMGLYAATDDVDVNVQGVFK